MKNKRMLPALFLLTLCASCQKVIEIDVHFSGRGDVIFAIDGVSKSDCLLEVSVYEVNSEELFWSVKPGRETCIVAGSRFRYGATLQGGGSVVAAKSLLEGGKYYIVVLARPKGQRRALAATKHGSEVFKVPQGYSD